MGAGSVFSAGGTAREPAVDTCHHAEDPVGIIGGEWVTLEHFAELEEDALVGAGLYVTGMVQNSLEGLGEAFAIGRGGGRGEGRCWGCRGAVVAGELIEADGDGLAEIDGFLHGLGGDVKERGAVAEVVFGEAGFLGAEYDGETAGGDSGVEFGAELGQRKNGLQGLAARYGGGAEDEGAVGDSIGKGGKFAGGGEDGGCADGGTSFLPGGLKWLNEAEVGEAEVDHGAGYRADVERIAGTHEDDGTVLAAEGESHTSIVETGGVEDAGNAGGRGGSSRRGRMVATEVADSGERRPAGLVGNWL